MKYSFLEKLGGGLLLTAWLLYGANWIGDTLTHVDPGPMPEMSEMPESVAQMPAEAPAAEAMDLGALLADASAEAGTKVFSKCKACHDAAADGRNKVGPNLWNVVGAGVGHIDSFSYSDALKGHGGTWTYENLDAFLANPKAFAAGTRMSFKGLAKPEDRAAVIAFLRLQSDSPVPLP